MDVGDALATKAFLTEVLFVLVGVGKDLQKLDGMCLEQVGPKLVADHIGTIWIGFNRKGKE